MLVSHVQVCPHCGDACLGTYRLTCVLAGEVYGIEVDRGRFDEMLGAVRDAGSYDELPELVRAHNELRAPFDADGPIDAEGLAETLRRVPLASDVATTSLREALLELATRAIARDLPITFEAL